MNKINSQIGSGSPLDHEHEWIQGRHFPFCTQKDCFMTQQNNQLVRIDEVGWSENRGWYNQILGDIITEKEK